MVNCGLNPNLWWRCARKISVSLSDPATSNTAPNGTVMIIGALIGGVVADRLTVNGGGVLRVVD